MTRGKKKSSRSVAIATAVAAGFLLVTPGAAQAGCKGSNDPTADISKNRARSAVACLINRERSARNVKTHRKLKRAAQEHTSTMRRKDCFSHQCPGEAPLKVRIARTGYSNSPYAGEVLISYPSLATPRQIVAAWMRSEDHRRELLRARYKHIGVGLSVRGDHVYYTVDLARP